MDCKKLNMRPEEVALVNSVKRNTCISPMQYSNVTAPFSSTEMPIKLNFAEPQCVDLMPPSQFEVFEQCGDQPSFLPVKDFQLGYLFGECGGTRFQNMEVPKWDTCISNVLLKHQQQPVLEQQHLDESTCVKQEDCYYPGLEKGNRHQLLEKISPVESTYGHCSCSCNKLQCKDSQWHPIRESMLNDHESSVRCLTLEDLSPAHIMPMLPYDSQVSPTSTGLSYSKRANSHEDIMKSHGHEMMVNSLPEKGKLLEAVVNAGPLLQTLLLAGPLPMWQRPPPDLDSSQIPLVPIAPTSPPIIPPLNPPAQSYPYSYSPLPLTPTSSSYKKRFMSMDDSLHNARSPLKHAKLQ